MNFVEFAASFGLIISDPIADGRFHRTRTEDHPRKKNGAYLYTGDRGVVKNFATMTEFETWKDAQVRHNVGRAVVKDVAASLKAERDRHAKARIEAGKLIEACRRGKHPYLAAKGFPEAEGLIHEGGDLILPMRDRLDYGTVNTAQRISVDGSKLFLTGGKAKGSIFILGKGSRGERFLVEGYATALSVQAALMDLRKRCEIWVCFSDSNLLYVAQFLSKGSLIVADNDVSGAGEKAARACGLPWIMPPEVGMDANDWHQKYGLRELVKLLLTLDS